MKMTITTQLHPAQVKHLSQLRPITLGSCHLFVVDYVTPVLPESIQLTVKVLLLSADTGVPEDVILHS